MMQAMQGPLSTVASCRDFKESGRCQIAIDQIDPEEKGLWSASYHL
jgi:hypothetical protein